MSSSKKKATPKYEATLRVLGKQYTAKGKTIAEAIGKLEPGNVAGMAILTVKKGKNSKDRVVPHVTAKRVFNTAGISRETAVFNISLMFEGI